MSALFAWAIAEGLVDSNPTIGTRRPDEGTRPRERVLSDEELAAIWQACDDFDYGRVVRLLILTGARRQEVGGMAWSELHERGTWTIPGERTKNGRAHIIALPALAWSIINAVPRRGDHLFGRNGFANWGRAKAAFDQRLSLPPWTLHDLRRSAATRMADLGILPHVIEAVLNHVGLSRKGVAGIYNRSSYEREARAALALWADHVRAIVEGGERKIVQLRQ